jgi:ATP-dependent HslUV protease ATP-binding subunit HslU
MASWSFRAYLLLVAFHGLSFIVATKVICRSYFPVILQELLKTEGVDLHFTDGAINAIAAAAEEANRSLDNIGARRLHTVLERILSDISYSAPEKVASAVADGQEGQLRYEVDEQMVEEAMRELLKHQDLSRYML